MFRLMKKKQRLDSVEAYACTCKYALCTCLCSPCLCVCQIGNPRDNDAALGYSDFSHNFNVSTLYSDNPAENIARW